MDVNHYSIWMGTAGGTFLSSLSLIQTEDIVVTAFLASLGAGISFLMSYMLTLILKPKGGRSRKNKKGK